MRNQKKSVVVAGVGFPELNEVIIKAHNEGRLELLGFLDDRVSEIPSKVGDFAVLGDWTLVSSLNALVINSVFKDCSTRKRAQIKLQNRNASLTGINEATNIHTTSFIDESAIVLPNVFTSSNIFIGAHSLIHRNVHLGHDVVVGENCFLGPGVICLGSVKISENCYIGAGAIIVNGISIERDSVIAAGSVVFNNVKQSSVVMGNPAITVGANNEIN